jgi:hypothetical protein
MQALLFNIAVGGEVKVINSNSNNNNNNNTIQYKKESHGAYSFLAPTATATSTPVSSATRGYSCGIQKQEQESPDHCG